MHSCKYFSTLLRDRPSVTCGSILQPGAHLPPHRLTVKRHCCVLHQGCARPGTKKKLLRAGQRKNLAGWARVNVCMVGRKSEKYNHKLNTGPDDFLLFSSSQMKLGFQLFILESTTSLAPLRCAGFVNFCGTGRASIPVVHRLATLRQCGARSSQNASEGQLRKS